ncbi:MAG: hypothetical protein A2857_06345 [Candidatus Levybacteria bacterium RIFCSPHIGHO2_01_FULL_36_15]|nr:MAG: hypothetical protein A2857_06345 [Candidatus Levybacteria bacterium RIFCSPHIGHO2_01_FULL_36_15]OGH38680.1 MAG: hypothetical protein A2905_02280 [Candidatus Levybacteria bacterium RIFCSPLOWO2_01_FULL_36_10]
MRRIEQYAGQLGKSVADKIKGFQAVRQQKKEAELRRKQELIELEKRRKAMAPYLAQIDQLYPYEGSRALIEKVLLHDTAPENAESAARCFVELYRHIHDAGYTGYSEQDQISKTFDPRTPLPNSSILNNPIDIMHETYKKYGGFRISDMQLVTGPDFSRKPGVILLGAIVMKGPKLTSREDIAKAYKDWEDECQEGWGTVPSKSSLSDQSAPWYLKAGRNIRILDHRFIYGRIDPPVQNETQSSRTSGTK